MHILKTTKPSLALCVILGLTGVVPVQAQTGYELPTISVEGSSLDGIATKTDRVGSSVSVITGKDLEQQKISHVADALRGLPGISVNRSGAFGGLTNIRIRGAEANHTLVIIDGVEANSNDDGSFDFSDLAVSNIESIEVIRGPQSGIYGSRALGGVINIKTKNGRGSPLRMTVKGEAGAFGTTSGSVNIAGGNAKVYASLTIDQFNSDGFNISNSGSEEDSASRNSIFFNGGFHPTKNLSINLVFRKVQKEGDRDDANSITGLQEDTPSTFDTDATLAGTRIKLKTFGGNWIHKLHGTINATTRRDNGPFGLSEFVSKTSKLSYINTILLPTGSLITDQSLTSLAEIKKETLDNSGGERDRNRRSYAAEYKTTFWNQLSISTSIRHDDNRETDVKDFTTYRISGSWKVPQTGFRLHSNVGTGVVFPTMFEQFGFIASTFRSNSDLNPEESFGWDAGIEWTSPNKKFVLDITYFNQDLKNEIETYFCTAVAPCPTGEVGFFSVRNREGDSTRKGVEISTTARITPSLTLTGSYTYLDAKDFAGVEERRRPKHSARANVNWRFDNGKGNLNFGVNYNGKAKDDYFPGFVQTEVTLDDYVLVSVAGSYNIRPNVQLFGRVENLLDENYEEVFSFNTPGIAAYAGVRVKLGPVQ